MLIECRVSKLSIFYSKPPLLFLAWEADCPSDPFHGFLIPFPSAQPDIWIQIAWKENLLTTKYCLISRYLDICIFKHYQVWSDIRALVIDFSIFPPSIDISTHILSLDNTNIKGTLTFLFCWRERERESIYNGKTNKLNPPQRGPWEEKVSRQDWLHYAKLSRANMKILGKEHFRCLYLFTYYNPKEGWCCQNLGQPGIKQDCTNLLSESML